MERLELKNRHGLNIVGILETPMDTPRGTCIILHGWGGNKERIPVQAAREAFLTADFQTVAFDATCSFGESDGDFQQSNLTTFAEDFEDVVTWVKAQAWFAAPLAVFGHSMGGYAAVRYAEDHPADVSYVVALAPVISGELSFAAHREFNPSELEQWEREGVLIKKGLTGETRHEQWSQMTERLNHDLLRNAGKVTAPVLLIVGSADTSCPPHHIDHLFEALPGGNKSMEKIPDMPHSFQKPEEAEAVRTVITDWLDQQS